MSETRIDEQGHFLHYCHCGKAAPFGFGIRLRTGDLGRWYCAEHVDEGEKKENSMPPLDPAVPSRAQVLCEGRCGRMINIEADGVHQWTCGWVMRRAGGGGHGVSLAVRQQRFMCRMCLRDKVEGFTEQPSLPL